MAQLRYVAKQIREIAAGLTPRGPRLDQSAAKAQVRILRRDKRNLASASTSELPASLAGGAKNSAAKPCQRDYVTGRPPKSDGWLNWRLRSGRRPTGRG